MPLSSAELAQARDTAAAVLEELGLSNYVFGVEPDGARWRVSVECATDGGWEALTLEAPWELLVHGRDDARVRERLREAWRGSLDACHRAEPSRSDED